ncbi:hypothetical protein GCM10027605_11730 [Micromonospora zhanjiangensis]
MASCPAAASSREAAATASRFGWSGRTPVTGERSDTATRSRCGGTSLSGRRPARTANPSAASATVLASMPCSVRPNQSSAPSWQGTTPRPGFSPTRPQQAAGMRIEPNPSLPCAIGTRPAATAAAAPPDDPPGVRSGCHGLRVTAVSSSVYANRPSSGIRVTPTMTAPAPRSRRTIS